MNNDLGILDLLLLIARNKKLVIWITVIAAICAISYSLLTPKYWKSTGSILPVSDDDMGASFSTSLLDIAGGGFLKTPKSEKAIDFITIMKSRGFREKVVRKFNLVPYFKITRPDSTEAMELAILALVTDVVKTSFNEESYVISITAETRNKKLSQDLVQYYIDSLESYNLNNRMSKGRQKRGFLEAQVATHMAEADSLALALRDFQVKNKSIALDKQTESMVTLYSESAAQYMQTEIDYELAKTQYGDKSPVLLGLAEKKNLLGKKLQEIESSNYSLTPKYMLQIDKIPDLSMQYAQLMISAEIKKKVLEYLYPQYELSKLEELKDLPTFEVIDPPQMPGLRSKPRRAIIVVISTLAAFLLACVIALIKEQLFVQNRDKVQEIFRTLFARK